MAPAQQPRPDTPERRAGGAEALRVFVAAHAGSLAPAQARKVLRSPYVDAELIDALIADKGLRGSYAVRRSVARHPRAAVTTALRLVPGLYWRDLVELTVDVRISPQVRRSAERYLLRRLPGMAAGEKIAVARRAHGAVLDALRDDAELRVLGAVLDNPRLREEALLRLLHDTTRHPRVLARVAQSRRWRMRYAVRRALAANPQTPFAVQLPILESLRRGDLEAIADDPAQSSVARRRASELLADRRRRPRAPDPADRPLL